MRTNILNGKDFCEFVEAFPNNPEEALWAMLHRESYNLVPIIINCPMWKKRAWDTLKTMKDRAQGDFATVVIECLDLRREAWDILKKLPPPHENDIDIFFPLLELEAIQKEVWIWGMDETCFKGYSINQHERSKMGTAKACFSQHLFTLLMGEKYRSIWELVWEEFVFRFLTNEKGLQ